MEPKQIIVIRKNLNMRKGKMIAQGAHASLKVILDAFLGHLLSPKMWWRLMRIVLGSHFRRVVKKVLRVKPDPVVEWICGRFTKVCVFVDTEEELVAVYEHAKREKVLCSLITDAGLTEFKGVPTLTCCAIGPDFTSRIDPITGHLPLL